jgi:hypothetical protein
MSKPLATRLAELNGAPPQLASAADLEAAGPRTGHTYMRQRSVDHKRGAVDGRGRINLKAVAEALIDEGLDPATEIARVLKGRPVLDDDGNEVIDPVTGQPVVEHLIDPDVRLRTLNSLLEFTQPKLKAIEVKMSGALELSSEQLDQRLDALIARAAKAP